MGSDEFEEILEECLSALLEGRRGIQESLSLYPAWRGRLEPLLKAAQETAAGLDQAPPPYVRERGLQRFLQAARARRRLRQILPAEATRTPWWRWAPAGLTAVAVIGALALMSATLMAEDGQTLGGGRMTIRPYDPTPLITPPVASVETSLRRVQEEVAILENHMQQGEPVEVTLLESLEEASNDLAARLGGTERLGTSERVAVVSVASRQYELLQGLQGRSTGVSARAVEAGLAAAANVLEKVGATPTTEPAATPSPAPTASPAMTPSPAPSPTPTAGQTVTPSPTPTAPH